MDIRQFRILGEAIIFTVALITTGLHGDDLMTRIKILAYIVVLVWVLYIFNALLLSSALNSWFAARPRSIFGLFCIPIAIFLHGDEDHLLGNTEGFLLFGGRLLFWKGISEFILVTLIALFVNGIGKWLFAKNASIGASGIILGYFGFLLFRGFFERDAMSALLTMLMMAFYSTVLFNLLPKPGVSWTGHFYGFLGGAIAAVYLNPIREQLLPHLFR